MTDASDKPRELKITIAPYSPDPSMPVVTFIEAHNTQFINGETIHLIEKSYADKLEAEIKSLKKMLAASHENFVTVCEGHNKLEAEANALAEVLERVTKCRCDEAWTKRDMHEPNSMCGEGDAELASYRKFKGQDTEGESSE